MTGHNWICSQFGAREFYSIPRMLFLHNQLEVMYTDLWKNNVPVLGKGFSSYASRNHIGLINAKVTSFDLSQLLARSFRLGTEKQYDRAVASSLRKINGVKYLFCYSYCCFETIRKAKDLGYTIIYGQINPGIEEAHLVRDLYKVSFGEKFAPAIPDASYWDSWEKELQYIDTMLVNSEWSKKMVRKSGFNGNIKVLPLAYENGIQESTIKHKRNFTAENPLKVLYLGTLSVRKGFHVLMNAMRNMSTKFVHLHVVGRVGLPANVLENVPDNVTIHGLVSPVQTDKFYREADVFILPTFSDGFGLTLLEAQKYRLPVITTPFCGNVIKNMENGLVIDEITSNTIVHAIAYFLENPNQIECFSHNAVDLNKYSMKSIYKQLCSIVE